MLDRIRARSLSVALGSRFSRGCLEQSVSRAPREMTASVVPAQEIVLRNGLTVSVRQVTRDDEAAICEFLTALSIDSRRLRFFSAATDLRAQAHLGAAGDDADHHGVLAVVPGRGVVGHATYVRVPHSERAEVAVEVADDLHHLGLATLLVIRLAEFAEHREITCFFAELLPENHDMLAVFRDGFAAVSVNSRGVIEVEFPTSSWRTAHARFR
ncbi:MAG: GNAT family N-acetyltransferase [Actinomycetota bacterium]|nr:GNAT family N-acetyltransferase [Actinomycetota bacterium]